MGIDDRRAVVATSTGAPRRPAALRALTTLVALAISAVMAACGTGTTGTGTTTTAPPTRSTPTPEATLAPVAPPSVVVIIRHGEKPDGSHPGIDANGNQDDSSLTEVGWDRARRLVDLFDTAQGSPRPGLARPTAIYAAGANDNGERAADPRDRDAIGRQARHPGEHLLSARATRRRSSSMSSPNPGRR